VFLQRKKWLTSHKNVEVCVAIYAHILWNESLKQS